ncbi:UDP-N-acetylmuramate--L-alanine ligase [Anoxynatronum buryatiense]|uniref:UDP-N-acetylmuramate--L-alanine ligase n=1 Tax=Anoxynatronum buryatiense TaxID=489973 RepID=A0AA45WW02_9CLOT|nr:UDP-N-acetylmuramate--L-alanine ligase [Anoxynatronum buryatiense]SMP51456.1 UDP-N-acetylmuramate--L-alanine ligase [Anoxynatronum buryatiense]
MLTPSPNPNAVSPTMPEVHELPATLEGVTHVHLVGIGGIGMSGLAHLLLKQGIQVSGSDRSDSPITRRLADEGARIFTGHHAANLQQPDWLVYSAAIPADNPERAAAREKGILQMDRAALLGILMKQYPHSISVAGSHGKTTTTALLAMLLEWGGLDPTILVGGELDAIGGNVKAGGGEVMITEACEYQGSFLRFPARIGLVLNIDLDHLDYFPDLAAIQAVFRQFVNQLPTDGLLVMPANDTNSRFLVQEAPCRVITIEVDPPPGEAVPLTPPGNTQQLTATALAPLPGGCWSFNLLKNGSDLGRFHLGIPGKHNVHNALAALAAALELGVKSHRLQELLPRFTGIHRRFETHGHWAGVTVVDDYAHHPAEITATLAAARTLLAEAPLAETSPTAAVPLCPDTTHHRIVCIFQPHTYTRTHALLHDFAQALALADVVVVTEIYAAREPDNGLVHSRDLVDLVSARGTHASYCPDYQAAARTAAAAAEPGDLIITMGAGPVNEAVPLISEALLDRTPNADTPDPLSY